MSKIFVWFFIIDNEPSTLDEQLFLGEKNVEFMDMCVVAVTDNEHTMLVAMGD